MKWTLPDAGARLEVDQFDGDRIYHVCLRDDGITIGYARLLPTTEPYLPSEVFRELMDGAIIPRSPAAGELSRLCSVDLRSPGEHRRQADFLAGRAVLRAAVQCTLEDDVRRLISVSPAAVERLSRLAVNASRASPTMQLHGHFVVASWLELDDIYQKWLGDYFLGCGGFLN